MNEQAISIRKTFAILILIFGATGASYGQDTRQVKILRGGSVNFKELSNKEKPPAGSLNQVGLRQHKEFKPFPIPKNAKVKKNDVRPGYMTKSGHDQKGDRKTNSADSILILSVSGLNGADHGEQRPPDMGGAVSENYLVEALNTQIGCFDKTGTLLSTVVTRFFFGALLPVVNVNLIFTDPRVLYDVFAQRWIIIAAANVNVDSACVVIAISDTSDPTSTWAGYSIDADPTDNSWLDYPTIGINKNWIAIGGNLVHLSNTVTAATNATNCEITIVAHGYDTGDRIQFGGVNGMTELNGNTYTITVTGTDSFVLNVNSSAFGVYTNSPSNGYTYNLTNPNVTTLFVMDKAAMYAGGPPTATSYNFSSGNTFCPALVCDNTSNDLPIIFTANERALGYYSISGTPTAPVLSPVQFLSVTAAWAMGMHPLLLPQRGSTFGIAPPDPRMGQVVLRNGSLWCAHTIFLPQIAATHSAVQWWQIDPATLNVLQLGRIEDPTGSIFYTHPSIDVNTYNDVLVGFSRFSSTQFGGSNYAYHLNTDAPGTMNPDIEFKAGLAKYDLVRWGDYSSTITDPDLFTIWTLQEYAELPIAGVDQWGTEWEQVTMPVPELYSKDRPEDRGEEPNPSSLSMWQSQDIWLRQVRDPAHAFAHMGQNAEYRTEPTNPNYVYVEVHNRGGAPSLGTEQLSLYWAKAGSSLTWPSSWDGSSYFDAPLNTMSMGSPIGTPQAIPVLAPGTSAILEFPWMPPIPDAYSLPYLIDDRNHFCLLARITTNAMSPYGMTFPETTDLYQNVKSNNNIVWNNIEVYNLDPLAAAYVITGNLTNTVMQTKFKFEGLDQNGVPGLLNNGKLKVEALGKLKEILLQNPPSGKGIKNTGEGTFEVSMEGAVLDNITLQQKDMGSLKITFDAGPTDGIAKGFAINVTQLEDKNGTDHIVGGQTFVFGQVKGFGTSPSTMEVTESFWRWWYWAIPILSLLVLYFVRKKKYPMVNV